MPLISLQYSGVLHCVSKESGGDAWEEASAEHNRKRQTGNVVFSFQCTPKKEIWYMLRSRLLSWKKKEKVYFWKIIAANYTHSFSKYLLSISHVLGAIISVECRSANKVDTIPYSVELRFSRGNIDMKQYILYLCWWSEQKLSILLINIVILMVCVLRLPWGLNEWIFATYLLLW